MVTEKTNVADWFENQCVQCVQKIKDAKTEKLSRCIEAPVFRCQSVVAENKIGADCIEGQCVQCVQTIKNANTEKLTTCTKAAVVRCQSMVTENKIGADCIKSKCVQCVQKIKNVKTEKLTNSMKAPVLEENNRNKMIEKWLNQQNGNKKSTLSEARGSNYSKFLFELKKITHLSNVDSKGDLIIKTRKIPRHVKRQSNFDPKNFVANKEKFKEMQNRAWALVMLDKKTRVLIKAKKSKCFTNIRKTRRMKVQCVQKISKKNRNKFEKFEYIKSMSDKSVPDRKNTKLANEESVKNTHEINQDFKFSSEPLRIMVVREKCPLAEAMKVMQAIYKDGKSVSEIAKLAYFTDLVNTYGFEE